MTSRPRFARAYVRISAEADRLGAAEHRRTLLADLGGAVCEVGAGHGLTFAHYPPSVTSVLAVEPEPTLRGLAEEAARRAPVPVTVVDGTADALPAPDAGCDAVVVSLVLCSVPDVGAALSEVRRVLRPGGVLAFYEHVRSPGRVRAGLEVALTPLWHRLAGGCHLDRDTLSALGDAGFDVTALQRFPFGPNRVASLTHVLGRATPTA